MATKGQFFNRMVQRYLWDPEPKNDGDGTEPIWCLGKEHRSSSIQKDILASIPTAHSNPPTRQDFESRTAALKSSALDSPGSGSYSPDKDVIQDLSSKDGSVGWPQDFMDDFEARFWFTYRSHFPPIKKSGGSSTLNEMSLPVRLRSHLVDQEGFTTDTGWGCMIRSGQSLLANTLSILRFGRSWRRGKQEVAEKALISLFADDVRAPFSIHRFVEHGAAACGKHPGMWFGPSATAKCIEALSKKQPMCGIRVYVNGDGPDVYEDEVLQLAATAKEGFQPTLILVGIRLGINGVTPAYWEALKATMKMRQTVGIAGGEPSASHYFVAHQGDFFFYLDPHQTKQSLAWFQESVQYSQADVDSCHTRRLRRVHIKDMDPSMLLGFLIKDETDWNDWKHEISSVAGKAIVQISQKKQPLSPGELVTVLDDESEGDDSSFVNL